MVSPLGGFMKQSAQEPHPRAGGQGLEIMAAANSQSWHPRQGMFHGRTFRKDFTNFASNYS